MAGSNEPPRPIIKRKKIIAGEGHHGGAWKVAYADFVTAMMAFFLLMWLLNATTESQRKGIADYFAPTVPVSPVSSGGNGAVNGDSVFSNDTLARDGTGGAAQLTRPEDGDATSAREGVSTFPDDEKTLENLIDELTGRSGESEVADDLLRHIVTRITDEGLVIEVFAREGRPLFDAGAAEPTDRMRAILKMIAEVAAIVTNKVAIDGHTDSTPFIAEGRDNWSLSAERADASRRALTVFGLTDDRMARITGHAAREPALTEAPEDPRNRRITITLLRTPR